MKRASNLRPDDVIVVLHKGSEWRVTNLTVGTETWERVPCRVLAVIPMVMVWRIVLETPDGRESFQMPWDLQLETVPERHPVCGECGELWPCRDARVAEVFESMTEEMA